MRSEVKTMVVKARRSLTEGPVAEADRHTLALEAVRALDRAASKGVLHRRNASRRKARLMRQLVKVAGVPSAAPSGAGARSKKGAPAAQPAKAPDKKAAAKKK